MDLQAEGVQRAEDVQQVCYDFFFLKDRIIFKNIFLQWKHIYVLPTQVNYFLPKFEH